MHVRLYWHIGTRKNRKAGWDQTPEATPFDEFHRTQTVAFATIADGKKRWIPYILVKLG